MKVKAPSLMKKIIEALSSKTNELRIRMMIFFLLHKNLDKSSLTNSLHALVSHHHKKKKNDDVLEDGEEEEEIKGSLLMNYNIATSMDDVMVSNTHDNMNLSRKHQSYNECYGGEKHEFVVGENLSRKHQSYNDDIVVEDENDDDDGGGEKHYPRVDLTNSIFEESKEEMEKEKEIRESQEMVVAEGVEDIDQAADLFIQRFRKQMLLQKQRSLERQQWLVVDA